jgi:uncharacterized protein (DUF3820 family)
MLNLKLWIKPTATHSSLHTKMPFGKYEEDTYRYTRVMWFGIKIKVSQRRIEGQLKLIYELKLNGLEELIRNIKRYPKPH